MLATLDDQQPGGSVTGAAGGEQAAHKAGSTSWPC